MKTQIYVLGIILGASLAAATLAVDQIFQNTFAQMDIRIAPTGANMTGNMTGAEEGIPTANTTAGPTGCAYTPEGGCENPWED